MKYLIIPAAALLAIAAGCSRETSAHNEPAAPKVVESPDPNLVQVQKPEQFPLVRVDSRKVSDTRSLNCVAAPDVTRTVHVTSQTAGRVVDVRAKLGDEVKQGQVLVVLNSSDLAAAIADYKKAFSDELLSRKELDRAQLLFSHGALAQKELDLAQNTEDKALTDIQAARDRIRILGGDLERPSPIIEVRAPISGTIVEQNIAGGEGVKSLDNSPSLFTLANLGRVWLQCDAYENDLAEVHLGDPARIHMNAYPDRPLSGRANNIASILDPATRTAKVRIDLENPGYFIKPGMFASAQFTSQRSRERAVLPASAILRLHDRDWVFRAEGSGRFRRIAVEASSSLGPDVLEVLEGVRPGDQVVANALQFSTASSGM